MAMGSRGKGRDDMSEKCGWCGKKLTSQRSTCQNCGDQFCLSHMKDHDECTTCESNGRTGYVVGPGKESQEGHLMDAILTPDLSKGY